MKRLRALDPPLLSALLVAGFAIVAAAGGGEGGEGGVQGERREEGPRLVFDAPVHDFGSAHRGAVVRHRFRYRNAGAGAVEIRGVRTSCGCTAAAPARRRIGPGESGEVEVAFDTMQKGAARPRERHENRVWLRVVDPSRPGAATLTSQLTLAGDVVVRYRFVPENGLVFPTFARGLAGGVAARVEVLPAAEGPPGEAAPPPLEPGPEGARPIEAPPGVTVTAVRAIERDGRRGVALECALAAGAPAGALSGTIRLATGHPGEPEIPIPVRALVQAAVHPIPERLLIPIGGDAAGGAERRIHLGAARRFEVRGACAFSGDGSPPAVDARPLGPVGPIAVAPRAGAGPPAAPAAGEVHIFLSDPEVPLIRVPFFVYEAPVAATRGASIRVAPQELDLGDVEAGGAVEVPVLVSSSGGEPLDPRDLDAEPAGAIEAEIETVAAGRAYRIAVRCAASAPGPIAGRVSLAPRPGEPRISIPVLCRALPALVAEPAALDVRPGAPAEVLLRARSGEPFLATSLEDPSGRLDVVAKAADGGLRIRASARGGAGPGPGAGEVVVGTDLAGAREIRIPFLIRP